LQVKDAFPVSIGPLADVAVMVTGPATAAVQVAVTIVAGEAERWTEGSVVVQFEFTSAAVPKPTHPEPLNRELALKV
jgi:hypothetical protein